MVTILSLAWFSYNKYTMLKKYPPDEYQETEEFTLHTFRQQLIKTFLLTCSSCN